MSKISKLTLRLLTRDWNVWPGLLLPPQRNKDGNVSVASLQEEVHSQLDSQTRENFLVPVAENNKNEQTKERKKEKNKLICRRTNVVLRRSGSFSCSCLISGSLI